MPAIIQAQRIIPLILLMRTCSNKNWIKKDGVASSGLVYPEAEINEWARFTSLYSHLFLDINFRNLTYYAMSNPRYNIDNVNRHKYLIKQMKMQVEKHRQEAFETILATY